MVLPVVLGVAVALTVAGCNGDDDEIASQPVTTPNGAQPTTPAPTTQAPATPTTPTTAAAPEPTPAAPTTDPNACETPETISRLKFQKVDCEGAAAVATAWDRMGNNCNTIDDPNSPEGYNRTCEVEGYACKAKRDVRSDARFVACAKGQAQLRFTWAPP